MYHSIGCYFRMHTLIISILGRADGGECSLAMATVRGRRSGRMGIMDEQRGLRTCSVTAAEMD